MIPGRIISFNENTGYGYVKLLDEPAYLDYKELWFSWMDVEGSVKRGDAVKVWVTDTLGVTTVEKLEKV